MRRLSALAECCPYDVLHDPPCVAVVQKVFSPLSPSGAECCPYDILHDPPCAAVVQKVFSTPSPSGAECCPYDILHDPQCVAVVQKVFSALSPSGAVCCPQGRLPSHNSPHVVVVRRPVSVLSQSAVLTTRRAWRSCKRSSQRSRRVKQSTALRGDVLRMTRRVWWSCKGLSQCSRRVLSLRPAARGGRAKGLLGALAEWGRVPLGAMSCT
jgi:hypothetical protein